MANLFVRLCPRRAFYNNRRGLCRQAGDADAELNEEQEDVGRRRPLTCGRRRMRQDVQTRNSWKTPDDDSLSTSNFPLSFNLAAYVNSSETLQRLMKLGVDLSRWDSKNDVPEFVLKLDFDRDVKRYVEFLHNVGVPADKLGEFITKNPLILRENMDDLKVRINYLQSKKFTPNAIAQIVSGNPTHLTLPTVTVDRQLGFLQREFKLSGDEVRLVTTRLPKLVSADIWKLKSNQFSLKEECGFNPDELRHLLKTCPKLWLIKRQSLVERFDYIHNKMGISHELILHYPGALMMRTFNLKQRHQFLEGLDRAQYDPKKPNYVSLRALITGSDEDFCKNVAKTSEQIFDDFLKTQ